MAEISKIQPFGSSTQYDIHALRADYIEGTNNAANPGGALLRSGSGRADASPGGDTWIYWDALGGTTNYWGIRHNQAVNTIGFCGSGTERVTIHMGESKVTATTFAGNATSATKLSNTPNNTSTFLRGDNTWSNVITGNLNINTSSNVSDYKLYVGGNNISSIHDYKITNLTGQGQISSHRRTAIALCQVSTTANTGFNSYSNGYLSFHRTNGLYGIFQLHIAIENQYAGANKFNYIVYGNRLINTGMTITTGYGFRPCTFIYNSNLYGGIIFDWNDAETSQFGFAGFSNFIPFAIDYYSTYNGGSILNQEIYNSINFENADPRYNSLCASNFQGTLDGNAATATALTSSAGSSTVPIYFSGGKPVQCSTTLGVSITGNAATATKLFNTPNNTTTFLRGDNTWSNQLTGDLTVDGLINNFKISINSTALNPDDIRTTNGIYIRAVAPSGVPISNHGSIVSMASVGTPSQFYIADSSHFYIYKRYYSSGAWSTWTKLKAGTADTLTTARNINGTSFNGSADITTANWGTARNISISDADASNTGTAVSVNGSAAVTLKLPSTIKATLTGNADTATALTSNAGGTEQPIYFSSGKPTATSYYLKANIANGTNYYQAEYSNNGRTIGAGSILRIPNIHYSTVTPSYTSGGEKYYKAAIAYITANYGNAGYLVGTFHPNSQGPFFGHIYNVNEKDSETGLPRYSTFIFHNLSGGLESFGTHNYNYYYRQYVYNSGTWGISITGNAATATKLSNTPNNTTTFLRGDNTWSNILTNGLTLQNGKLWIQGNSDAGSNTNRLTTTSGMPGNMQYNQGRRGTQIYANGIAFADPYNGNSNSDAGWIRHIEESTNSGLLEIAVGDDGNEQLVVRQYNTSNTIIREAYLLNTSGATTFPVSVTAPKFIGALQGNADTATEFSSNATVTLTGDTTGTSTGSKKSWSIATTTKLLTGTEEAANALTTSPGDGKIRYSYAVSSGTTGLFGTSSNANSILTLNRHNGSYHSQLGFSSNGHLYYRSAIDTTTKWNEVGFLNKVYNSTTTYNLNDMHNPEAFELYSWDYARSTYVNGQPGGDGVSSAGAVLCIPNEYGSLQMWWPYNGVNDIRLRTYYNSTWYGDWAKLLTSGNYTDYTVTKTGSGASGTWGISITGNAATSSSCSGNAATATKLNSTGTTGQFWRGDNTWSNILLGPLKLGTSDIAANTGYATSNSGSQNYIVFYGVNGDGPGLYNHTYIGESIYGPKNTANEQSELLLYHGNDPAASSGPDRIRLFAGQIDLQVYTSSMPYISGAATWDDIRSYAGTQVANFKNGVVTITGNCNPEADNTRSLGISGTRWKEAYIATTHGALDGNASSASTVAVTDTGTPSSNTSYYILHSTGKSGNQTVRGTADFFLYRSTGNANYLNIGAAGHSGGITLRNSGDTNSGYLDIVSAAQSAYHIITFPNATGTVALTSHNHDSTYKKIQTAVSDPTASSAAIAFIDTISQDTQGKITVTKKTVCDASASQSGIVSTSGQTFAGVKTFNDAIIANANKNYPFYTDANTFYVNKTVNWNSSSYYEWVYLLIPVLTSTNQSCMNYIEGTFNFWKTGGNVYDNVKLNLNCCYNCLEYYLESYGQGTDWKLVTCTYNGIKYYALKGYYHANPYTHVTFSGHVRSQLTGGNDTSTKALNLPYAVAYYNYTSNSANAVVLNSEIYNSLSNTLTDTNVTSVNRRSLSNAGGFIGNLTGNAATATALTSNAGSSTVPIYFSGGKPVQCSTTLGVSITGNADTVDNLHATNFARSQVFQESFNNVAKDYGNCSGMIYTADGAPNGQAWYHYLQMTYNNTPGGGAGTSNYWVTQLASTPGTPSNVWFRSRAGGDTITSGWSSWIRCWMQGNAVTGAVWNDYAEYREAETIEPGYILCEKGDGSLYKSTKRCQEFAGVSSDTWGFAQGETEKAKTPIAVSGRVLVYVKDKVKVNDYICSGPDGIGLKMHWWEKILYPHRVVGIVSEIPTYEKWGGGDGADRDPVDVNGRIWIKCCN